MGELDSEPAQVARRGAVSTLNRAFLTGSGPVPMARASISMARGEFPGTRGECPTRRGEFPTLRGVFPITRGVFPNPRGGIPRARDEFPEACAEFPKARGGVPVRRGDARVGRARIFCCARRVRGYNARLPRREKLALAVNLSTFGSPEGFSLASPSSHLKGHIR